MTDKNEFEIEMIEEGEEILDSGRFSSSGIIAELPDNLRLRSIILKGVLDEDVSSNVVQTLLSLNAEDPTNPVVLYINTYGGVVYDLLGIYDIMQYISMPVWTVGFGKVMSAGAILLAAGEPGHRYALPNTSIMVHQIRGGTMGALTDINATTDHINKLQIRLQKILVKHTKFTNKQVSDIFGGADKHMFPIEARKYGIIDKVSGVMPKIMI